MDRTDPTVQKTLLNTHKEDVQRIFEKYSDKNNFMAVYFTDKNKPYITFGETEAFNPAIKFGRSTNYLAFVYSTSEDFSEQTSKFLI